MRFVQRMRFRAIEFNVDSKVVVEVVQGKNGGSLVGRALVGRICRPVELDSESDSMLDILRE
ncbi:hypothetical protein TSUD_391380 [Trifolium subterraneum]|uniref:Uncharacterized protein n=1 Tax=Trifolium subterraneum TaxID=3900 RepID=A0A2Z6MZ69_TRISU|nr:hypothetical protein TSUD_391380 [Trifolium subterraneum]